MDEQMREKVKSTADRLIAEFYDSVAEQDWLMWATEAVGAMEDLLAALSHPAAQGEYVWECNECGAQEYTMCVSESDVQQLGCGNCGGAEWHKAKATP